MPFITKFSSRTFLLERVSESALPVEAVGGGAPGEEEVDELLVGVALVVDEAGAWVVELVDEPLDSLGEDDSVEEQVQPVLLAVEVHALEVLQLGVDLHEVLRLQGDLVKDALTPLLRTHTSPAAGAACTSGSSASPAPSGYSPLTR